MSEQAKTTLITKSTSLVCHVCSSQLLLDHNNDKRADKASCPTCGTNLFDTKLPSLSGNLALAIACLMLLIPVFTTNFISIKLFGVNLHASLIGSIVQLANEGFLILAILVAFCTVVTPVAVCSLVISSHIALKYRLFSLFKFSMDWLHHLKPWMMIDVMIISIAVSCFKLKDYADITFNLGLFSMIFVEVMATLLLSRISTRRYWNEWQTFLPPANTSNIIVCNHCSLSQEEDSNDAVCRRCTHTITKKVSLEKTWVFLITATICLIPANTVPISVLVSMGNITEDTILSGVMTLMKSGMVEIAAIIFIASIVVPVAKIIGLFYLLLNLKNLQKTSDRTKMKLYYIIHWVGKWSVLDILVIAIMMLLMDRGQIIDFLPGYGAIAFGAVVIFTMFAAEGFDPRVLWEQPSQRDKK
ncbi:paraquat-inducible protein A [Vibrio sp.]|nr:paraquat-inducible protein A [Vibrio sp.]